MACLSKNMKAFIAVAALFVLALAQNDQVLSASCRDRNVSRSAASQLAESAQPLAFDAVVSAARARVSTHSW